MLVSTDPVTAFTAALDGKTVRFRMMIEAVSPRPSEA
jgi:hypothetical protein